MIKVLKIFISVVLLHWQSGAMAVDSNVYNLRVAIPTRNPDVNKPHNIAVEDVNRQHLQLRINNHEIYLEMIRLKTKGFMAVVTAYVDSDHPDSRTIRENLFLKPGKRVRLYLRGPLIKRAPLEFVLQQK